jgi:hypothetical protein
MEYWAEATQSWFDCNRANDNEHGPIDTREKLKPYDPDIAKLLTEVYGDTPWRYIRPAKRPAAERAHLTGFDPSKAGRFVWPKEAPPMAAEGSLLAWLEPQELPKASPDGNQPSSTVYFVNRSHSTLSIDWIDFEGRRQHMHELRPGTIAPQETFATHVWGVFAGDKLLGGCIATNKTGRLEIR